MHYYVVGLNGSGKTTLLREVSKQTGLHYIHGTTELMANLGITGNYDALRAMDQDAVLTAWGRTATKLGEQFAGKTFLLDTHIMNLTHGRIIRRDGPWIADYDALIVVTAPIADIMDRLNTDTERQRALFNQTATYPQKLSLLEQYHHQTLQLAHDITNQYDLPLHIVRNYNGHFKDAVRQLKATVQSYKV